MSFGPASVRLFGDGDAAAAAGGVFAALAVLAIYWPVLKNGFVLDDWAILDVHNVVGLGDPALWRETLFRAPDDVSALFRPLTMLSYLLQLWTWPVVPPAFHFVNLVIHAFSVFLLVLVAHRLPAGGGRLPSILLAVACGLLYGLHPALTEPVIWITARADLLITFLLLLALVADRDLPEQGWGRAVAVGFLFLAALLCKETAVAFLVVLPLVHVAVLWLEPHDPGRGLLASIWNRHRRVYFALAPALTAYFAVRLAVTGPSLGLEQAGHQIDSFAERLLVAAVSMAQHMRNAFWPFQGIIPLQHLQLPLRYPEVLPAITAGVVVIVAAVAALFTRSARVPALLLLAFVAALLPVSNIVPIPAVVAWDEISVGTRYLAFPLAFACLAVPHAVRLGEMSLGKRFRHGAVLAWIVLGSWMLGSAVSVRAIIPLWSNDLTLSNWAIEQEGPRFWRHACIGMYYLRIRDDQRARDALVAALGMRDNAGWIWSLLGKAEAGLGRLPEARQAFRRALDLGTDEIRSRLYLADVEQRSGNHAVAAGILEEGLKRAPRVDPARWKAVRMRYQLGLSYIALGRTGEAATELASALELAHDPAERRLIAETLRSIGPDR